MRYSITHATVEQIKATGGTVIKALHNIPVVFAELTPTQAQRLKSQGATVKPVEIVTSDGVGLRIAPPVPIAGTPTYTASQLLEIADLDALRALTSPPLDGTGINVAILGTGIRATHELIRGRVTYSKNFSSSPFGDAFDHDTAVAAILVACAPECNILDIKVLDDNGRGTDIEVATAIDHLLDLHDEGSPHAPRVINLSLGAPDDGDPDAPLRMSCRAAIEKKIWVTAACGNAGPGPGTITSPATEKFVCALGSCKADITVSDYSSRGPTLEGLIKPDAVFFGENMVVASSASDTATAAKSGTSFATPFSSGAWALYFQGFGVYKEHYIQNYPQLEATIEEVFLELAAPEAGIDYFLPQITIKPQGASASKDNDYGYGLPFGPLAYQVFAPSAGIGLSSMVSMVMVVGMMGIMMKVMSK